MAVTAGSNPAHGGQGGILNGTVGEVWAGPLAAMLHGLGLNENASAMVSVVVSITYFSIVVVERVPKRIAQFNAEGFARLMALSAFMARPFVHLLSLSTDDLLQLLGKDVAQRQPHRRGFHAMRARGRRWG